MSNRDTPKVYRLPVWWQVVRKIALGHAKIGDPVCFKRETPAPECCPKCGKLADQIFLGGPKTGYRCPQGHGWNNEKE